MKIKDFLKSTAFRCIMVLLVIALLSGGLLSVLNDLLSVSDEEKLQRVIDKLYSGNNVTVTELELTQEQKTNEYGTINIVYELSDGNLIVQSTGEQGYKGGTVTVWTVVTMAEGDFAGVQGVSIESNTNQTLMSSLGAKFLSVFSSNNTLLLQGEYFTTGSAKMGDSSDGILSVATGATYSSHATNNAVNAAVYFAKYEYKTEVKAE